MSYAVNMHAVRFLPPGRQGPHYRYKLRNAPPGRVSALDGIEGGRLAQYRY